MQPQQPPNKWSCLPTAFAIVLERPVQEIIQLLGHDGSEVVWPHLPEPYCRRSFHIQELIYACYNLGYSVIEYQKIARHAPEFGKKIFETDFSSIFKTIIECSTTKGVLTGVGLAGIPHAIAWSGADQKGYDSLPWSKERLKHWFRVEAFYKLL